MSLTDVPVRKKNLILCSIYSLERYYEYKMIVIGWRLCSQRIGSVRRQPIPLSDIYLFKVHCTWYWGQIFMLWSNWFSFWFVDRFSCGVEIALNEGGDEGVAGNPTSGDTSPDKAHSEQVSKHTYSYQKIDTLVLLMHERMKVYNAID